MSTDDQAGKRMANQARSIADDVRSSKATYRDALFLRVGTALVYAAIGIVLELRALRQAVASKQIQTYYGPRTMRIEAATDAKLVGQEIGKEVGCALFLVLMVFLAAAIVAAIVVL